MIGNNFTQEFESIFIQSQAIFFSILNILSSEHLN